MRLITTWKRKIKILDFCEKLKNKLKYVVICYISWKMSRCPHWVGYSIAATGLPDDYNIFLILNTLSSFFVPKKNTLSFVTSLSTVLLIIGGFPLKHKVTTWLLMMTICLSIVSMLLTYLVSIFLITAENKTLCTTFRVMVAILYITIALCTLVLFLHIMRFLVWIGKKLRKVLHTKHIVENSVILP